MVAKIQAIFPSVHVSYEGKLLGKIEIWQSAGGLLGRSTKPQQMKKIKL